MLYYYISKTVASQ
uniref:Uncharacterized protein n=1 Tax=Arundo donax TaxID=35708 RepID=A0A0A9FU09_ARUDO